MTPPALELRHLVKRFRGTFGRATGPPAVDDVDLVVQPGEVVGLIGESGSGKTTLVRTALALHTPDAGSVRVLGQDPFTLAPAALRALRREAQLLFQDPAAMLNPGLTLRQHLWESARLHRPDLPTEALVEGTAERVGLAHRLDSLPAALSGGERRRAGLARVLMARPRLLVADEPTAGLDAARKADLVELVVAREEAGAAVVLVSHDLPLVAHACTRVVVLLAGRVMEAFPVTPGLAAARHPYTHTLLRSAGMPSSIPALPHDAHRQAAGRGAPGCPWAGACPHALRACSTHRPLAIPVVPGHDVACHAVTEGAS